jgi:hypothetical protein
MNVVASTAATPLAQEDFTVEQYRELLTLAKHSYRFVSYDEIPENGRFVLWRHDVDYSMNRSLRLAEIERDAGVTTTYFLNPHCEFYNLLEKEQRHICLKLVELGHNIGLHFDADYHDVQNESQLDLLVAAEASFLGEICGAEIKVFSFHNPTNFLLSCDRDRYGGLINCYSESFKANISYCSDSNGYWRFRRLRDVLEQATDMRLQVLTHPGWWQEEAAPPRQRIFRSVFGRANAVMKSYDDVLAKHGRENLTGASAKLQFIKPLNLKLFQLCDYLWNGRETQVLLLELFRMHHRCIFVLCRLFVCGRWGVIEDEFDTVWGSLTVLDHVRMFEALFRVSFSDICETSSEFYSDNFRLCQDTFLYDDPTSTARIEAACVLFCEMTQRLLQWSSTTRLISVSGADLLSRPITMSPVQEGTASIGLSSDLEAWKALRRDFEI